MGEFLIELLFAFGEVLLELTGEAILDLISRAMANVFESSEIRSPALAFAGYAFFGLVAGIASLAVFPHPLFRRTRFHGISLIVSPTLAGMVMSWIGAMLRSHEKKTVRIESFAYGFVFAFGMAFIRLTFAR